MVLPCWIDGKGIDVIKIGLIEEAYHDLSKAWELDPSNKVVLSELEGVKMLMDPIPKLRSLVKGKRTKIEKDEDTRNKTSVMEVDKFQLKEPSQVCPDGAGRKPIKEDKNEGMMENSKNTGSKNVSKDTSNQKHPHFLPPKDLSPSNMKAPSPSKRSSFSCHSNSNLTYPIHRFLNRQRQGSFLNVRAFISNLLIKGLAIQYYHLDICSWMEVRVAKQPFSNKSSEMRISIPSNQNEKDSLQHDPGEVSQSLHHLGDIGTGQKGKLWNLH